MTTEDRRQKMEKNGISNIEQGISNDEGWVETEGRRQSAEERGKKTRRLVVYQTASLFGNKVGVWLS